MITALEARLLSPKQTEQQEYIESLIKREAKKENTQYFIDITCELTQETIHILKNNGFKVLERQHTTGKGYTITWYPNSLS